MARDREGVGEVGRGGGEEKGGRWNGGRKVTKKKKRKDLSKGKGREEGHYQGNGKGERILTREWEGRKDINTGKGREEGF